MACLSLLVGGFAGGGWFIHKQILKSGALDVTEVAVFGAKRVGDELAAYLQLRPRMPLSEVDTERIEARLARHPWVKAAAVNKDYPHKLVVRLEEREPFLYHLASGAFYVVDREGVWIKEYDEADGFDLPVVTNIAVEPVTAATAALRRVADFITYWDAVSSPVRVGEVHYVNESEVIVYTLSEGPSLHLSLDADQWPALRDRLVRVLEEAKRMGVELRRVDLLYPDRAIALRKI
jgi:cell division septal protein FtsQ